MPYITMLFKNCDRCPGKVAERCVYFYTDDFEARIYYSALGAEWCRKSEHKMELYRLLNLINARCWPYVTYGVDGEFYKLELLFYPRFYITEDDSYDITATMLIPYSHYKSNQLQTEDFITGVIPNLLDALSTPIFLLLLGEITVDEAIHVIQLDVLSNSEDNTDTN